MWTMEDVLSELNEKGENNGEKNKGKNNGMAPGFRFHPTDEELITFYLASKVFYNHNFTTPFHIAEVDLNRCEPWDLPEGAKMGEKEWYIYSLRDRKYPTGLRTNRATGTGYWKATGKDRQIHAGGNGSATGVAGNGSSSSGMLIGMKKTLVFYQGRAPRGVKTRWVMHEYRLDGLFSSFRLSSKEEWVICRIFQKHGGEKKHFHPPPPPLSPFLRCLPPLLDVPTTSSSSSSTTQSLQNRNNNNNNNNNNKPNHFPTYNDSNFLLQSLLSNPLPNFSSLTNDTTPTTTLFSPHSAINSANPIASTTAGPTGIDHLLKQKRDMQQYQNNMDKICHATTNDPLFSMGGDVEDDVAVRFDMSSSVATLDRLLNPHQHHHHVNFSTESWPFHQ